MGDDNKSLGFIKNIVGLLNKPKNYIYFLTIISSIFVGSKNLNDQELDVELQVKELNGQSVEKSTPLNLDIAPDNSILNIGDGNKPFWLGDSYNNFSLQSGKKTYTPDNFLIKSEEKVKKIDENNIGELFNLFAETSKKNFIKAFGTGLGTDACFVIDGIYGGGKGQFFDTIRAIGIAEGELRFGIRSEDMNNGNNISTFQINGKSQKEAEINYSKFYLIGIKFIKEKLGLVIPNNYIKGNIDKSQEELISYIGYLKNRSLIKNEDLFHLLSNMSHSDKGFSKFISTTVQGGISEVGENVIELLNGEWEKEIKNESL